MPASALLLPGAELFRLYSHRVPALHTLVRRCGQLHVRSELKPSAHPVFAGVSTPSLPSIAPALRDVYPVLADTAPESALGSRPLHHPGILLVYLPHGLFPPEPVEKCLRCECARLLPEMSSPSSYQAGQAGRYLLAQPDAPGVYLQERGGPRCGSKSDTAVVLAPSSASGQRSGGRTVVGCAILPLLTQHLLLVLPFAPEQPGPVDRPHQKAGECSCNSTPRRQYAILFQHTLQRTDSAFNLHIIWLPCRQTLQGQARGEQPANNTETIIGCTQTHQLIGNSGHYRHQHDS